MRAQVATWPWSSSQASGDVLGLLKPQLMRDSRLCQLGSERVQLCLALHLEHDLAHPSRQRWWRGGVRQYLLLNASHLPPPVLNLAARLLW